MILSQGVLFFASIAACSTAAAASDGAARPRGVGPEFAKFYKDTTTFSCISNPAIQIPFSAVNDDYCDCPDGSDEPGTSACSYLSRNYPLTSADRPGNSDLELTLALPGFYCKNKGHKPSFVSFQRVNDGICDYEFCCDGSDEWAHVGGTKCEDKCKEIGKQWRKQEEKRAKSMTAALKKKKELLVDSGRQQKEVEDHIRRFEVEIQALEMKVKDMEADYEEVKKREESKMVRGKKAGKVNILASLAKGRVEELRNALVEVRKERDEARSRLKELEDILSKFKIEYNPNFNDEGVKRAVRSWEEYAAREDVGNLGNSARDRDLDEIAKPDDNTSGVNWEQWENEEDETDAVYKLAAYLPPSIVSFVEDKVISIRRFLEDNDILPKEESSTGESKVVTEAREGLEKTKTSLAELYTQLKNHQADLETDYGKAGVFRALKGVCISKDSGEYTYEHCFLGETKQIPKKGGATIRMGKFGRIGSVIIDNVNETGVIVPEERVSLEYTNGQTCWNGPARSTTVILECGEENEILKVTEDEKCVYSMIVTTPAIHTPQEEQEQPLQSLEQEQVLQEQGVILIELMVNEALLEEDRLFS
ncbi:hypothetical protein KXW62_000169 [Aspergillus fumigatus]|nr:hypothetical protein KXW62_000169 [Aspergillus fumigatus]